jgi:hypothetical protein
MHANAITWDTPPENPPVRSDNPSDQAIYVADMAIEIFHPNPPRLIDCLKICRAKGYPLGPVMIELKRPGINELANSTMPQVDPPDIESTSHTAGSADVLDKVSDGLTKKASVPSHHFHAVQDLLWTAALVPAARWAQYSNRLGSFDSLVAGNVVSKILGSDDGMLRTWQSTTSSFRDRCYAAVADIISELENTVADLIERFPESTQESKDRYRRAVNTAAEACFAIVPRLLDEHIHSPGYQGDKSWETMEEAVVAKAKAGDPAAEGYVESHDHLPEHPGKPYWIDYPAEFFDDPKDRYEVHMVDSVLQDIFQDEDEVCRILNEWSPPPPW